MPRVPAKILERCWRRLKKLGQPAVSLQHVAAPAGRNYVATRPVPASDPRLHVIDRQLVVEKYLAAVHAPVTVAREDLFTVQ
jgi:hypothetical protein